MHTAVPLRDIDDVAALIDSRPYRCGHASASSAPVPVDRSRHEQP
ncbi:MAG: hypothetical protein QM686_07235 [Herbaspirillum sp.]